MPASRNAFRMDHPIVLTFLIIAIVASMSLAAEVLKPLTFAVLLCFALGPIVRLLERLGLPRAPAVILTVVTALGSIGVVSFVVGQQLTALADKLPSYEENIKRQVERFKPTGDTALDKASRVAADVAETLDEPKRNPKVQDVRVVSQPNFRERLTTAVGPYLESVGVGFLILIMVIFMLINREDLTDRVVQLFGRGRITLTTRTMEEVGQRISRYLVTFAAVNISFGLVICLGLCAIGLPYAVLWGFLAGALRFIPYAGAATAFVLPFIFSIAYFPDWTHPMMIVTLFVVIEVIMNSFLEPMIYGKTTGLSALGLLIAAMFWTWLWGGLGLLMSTPLTVCLAVLGKYVPSLSFFATLLGEDAELDQDLRYYQRVLALDQDGADAIIEEALKKAPRAQVFDTILIPALSRAQRDYARGELDDRDRAFLWRVVGDVIDELSETDEIALATAAPGGNGTSPNAPKAILAADLAQGVKIVGVPTGDTGDTLVLRMLAELLRPVGVPMEILEGATSPFQVADQLAERGADLAVVSYLPPGGLTSARYLVRRLRARFADLPILVGRWNEQETEAAADDPLKGVGATRVVFRLEEARDTILAMVTAKMPTIDATTPNPGLASATAGAASS